jgi:large subunit ribosomal protein L7/L12
MARTWPENVRELGDKISALSLVEFKELSHYLSETHSLWITFEGVQPNMGGASAASASAAVFSCYSVIYEGLLEPAKKINVIKVIREITGLGLKEAKDASEQPPHTIKTDLYAAEAEKVAQNLRDAGARVRVERQ